MPKTKSVSKVQSATVLCNVCIPGKSENLCVLQRSLQTFEAVLQNVETWLLERVNQEPGFLEKIQLALRYRATSVQWLDEFRGEVAKQLSQELQNCEGALPANLVEEFQTDGFWRHYVGDWLLTQASVDPPPAQPLGTRQGTSPHSAILPAPLTSKRAPTFVVLTKMKLSPKTPCYLTSLKKTTGSEGGKELLIRECMP